MTELPKDSCRVSLRPFLAGHQSPPRSFCPGTNPTGYIREKIAEAKKQKEEDKTASASTADDPIKMPKARYEKDGISKEEFEEMKKDLE